MKFILWEIVSYLTVFAVWLFFRRVLKRNITGDILIGTVFGVFSEFFTEPFVNYHFKLTFYKDVPVVIPIAWGMMFAMTAYVSERLYSFFLKRRKIVAQDKRILVFDVIAGLLVGFFLETVGSQARLWEYNSLAIGWNLGTIPFLNMPVETLIAYALIMLVMPTVVRYWHGSFEGRL
ncbi:MAG: hypothetical protein LHV69_08410 [Elusimicrobia bacterium]|nr:hypothetical protein [Candidatus Obscuribacterium magneticum]